MNNYEPQKIAAKIKAIAKNKNIPILKMLEDCNLSKNTLSTMQSGKAMPMSETLAKIADYLDVSIDYLLDREQNNISEEEIKFALFHGSENITDEMYEEVLRFAEFVKEKYNNKGE